MSEKSDKYISVFIPVFNGEKYLALTLDAILNQVLPTGFQLELLVTDSGSTDDSVKILKRYAKTYPEIIVFNEIPNSEFGHGRTRQLAAERAKGEYIAFLSQDATPYNSAWLAHLIEPLFVTDRIGLVYGKQIPRKSAAPILKREVASVFGHLGESGTITLQRTGSFISGHINDQTNNFFSDVNSATRKSLLMKIPFRDVIYAEDQALAQDMQRAGYIKAYAPDGAVEHTNEYTSREYLHRKFDEYLGLQKSTGYIERPSYIDLALGWIGPTIKDWLFTIKDRDYSVRLKMKYILLVPIYAFNGKCGKFLALKDSSDINAVKLSLESRNKQRRS